MIRSKERKTPGWVSKQSKRGDGSIFPKHATLRWWWWYHQFNCWNKQLFHCFSFFLSSLTFRLDFHHDSKMNCPLIAQINSNSFKLNENNPKPIGRQWVELFPFQFHSDGHFSPVSHRFSFVISSYYERKEERNGKLHNPPSPLPKSEAGATLITHRDTSFHCCWYTKQTIKYIAPCRQSERSWESEQMASSLFPS